MVGEVPILGNQRDIHHRGTEITELALNLRTSTVLVFILWALCVSVVRNSRRAGDLIMQNKANFRRLRIDTKCRT
jgi:hypothetical protein